MNKLTKSGLILLGLHYLIFAHPKVVKSQIIPDGTLPNNSAVSTNDKITEISGGTTARNNLFHSFSEFSVPTGNIVFFNNPLTVENIFSRVTGSSVSNIDGILRANGTANLFLINPKGILFGPNATLDLGGSFFASTADRIIFADGTEFSATAPANSSLLTVSVPVGLGFGKNGGAIRVSGKGYETSLPAPATDTRNNIIARTLFPFARTRTSPTGLEVKPEKTLALVGGDIFLEGGILSAKDGSVALGSVRSGRIGLDYNAETWTLDYENVSNFGDIKLSDRSLVEVSGRPQSIEIWGNNLSLTEGSLVVIQNQSQGSIGNLTVNASNSLSIVGTSGAQAQESRSSLVSESIGLGDGGNIQISAKQLRIEEGGGIRSAGLNRGRGGNINLTAENILLRETTPFGSFSGIATITAGFGEGGKVNVSARTLAIADGAALGSSTYGAANGGNVTVNVSERVEITGISRIPIRNTTVLGSAPTLNANLASLTFGSGRGGNLVLSTPLLFLNQEGIITSSTVGSGRAGDIAIAADLIEIDGTSKSLNNSYISNSTIGTGNAGNLSIDATNLIIRDGGGVSTSTTAAGNSGELVINISDSLELSGVDSLFGRTSFILSSAPELNETIQQLFRLPPIPTGEPKNVVINAGRLVLSDAALISVRNDGTGNAGEIQINSPSITLNNAKITATTHSGEGGNIKIASEDIRLLNGSQISATAGGTGNGGNIFLNADTLIALDKKTIVANAFARRGGNISINARAVFTARPINETFDASSQLGIDGTITINTPEIDIEKELEQFNSQIIPIEQVVARSCVTERNARQGSFVITGNGGLPATSETAVDEFHLDEDRGSRADGRSSQLTVSDESDRLEAMPNPSSPEMRSISSVAPWKPGDPIVQGTTLVYTEDGRLLLVAEASSEKVESAEDLVCD